MKTRIIVFLTVFVIFGLLFGACIDPIPFEVPEGMTIPGVTDKPTPVSDSVLVTGITLGKDNLFLNVGRSETLTAAVAPSNATNKNVTWSSNNNDVATVNNGTVTAIAIGSAVITVTTQDGNKTAACNVTVNTGINAQTPVITSQPVDATVTANVSHTLSIEANVTDGGNLSYQWYSNTSASDVGGTAIGGAVSASYNPPTGTAGSYYYYVEVTNTITDNGDGGNKTATIRSDAVTLTVNAIGAQTPNITKQPVSSTVTANTSHTLSVTANVTDGGALSYQWYSNTSESNVGGTAIGGETSASYDPPTGTSGMTYYYFVEVTNTITDNGDGGNKTAKVRSNAITLTVNTSVNAQTPNITSQPAGATVIFNTSHSMSVTASVTDGGALSYQWYSNTSASNIGGSVITGATSTSYNPPTGTAAGTFYYFVEVINTITDNGDGGNKTAKVRSNAVTLTVNAINAQAPSITSHPVGATIDINTSHTLSVTANSTDGGALSYQWYSNTSASNSGGSAIGGATSASYNPSTGTAGTDHYYVEVTNTITDNGDGGNKTATVRSNAATLTITVPVTGVTLNKTSITIAVGSTETLSATVAPSNATNKNVTWTSSNNGVATVNNGVVTALTAGTATITVTTQDGSHSANCTVTVIAVTKITITTQPTKTRYAIGEQLNINGLVVTATYSDSSTKTATITLADISGFNSATVGEKILTVTYSGQTATFTVTVTAVVTFNPNGGNWNGSTANKIVEVEQVITITKPDDPAKTGYTLGGWYKEASLTNQWNFTSDTVTTNTTLYAKWNPITYTVRYDKNDPTASGTMADSSHTYDVEKALNANVYTRANYAFSGWNSQADGNGTNYTNGQTVKNLTVAEGDIIILYAVWLTQDTLDFGPGVVINNIFNVANLTEWNTAVSTISSGGNDKNYIINITADFSVPGSTSSTFGSVTGIKVSIRGTGRTLTLSSNASILNIRANQTVILRDVTLRGRSSNQSNSLVDVSGTFIMQSGEISGNTRGGTSPWGGGVIVGGIGTFIMNGGKISNNTAVSGGGVRVIGTFTMNGGEISGNTANVNSSTAGGGGVFVENGTFTMNGGKISGNKALYPNPTNAGVRSLGGGVHVVGGTFTMNSGEISGNSAQSTQGGNGGGVYVRNGDFNMYNGKISGNNATDTARNSYGNGGGVYFYDGTFTIYGGEISGNTANFGGGVVNGGSFCIITGTIYGSNEVNTSLRNTGSGAALNGNGVAQYGTFNGGTWNSNGDLTSTDNTIRVVNGVLQP